jgi:hypothetical protein
MQEKIHRMTVVLVCLVLVGAQSFLGCSMLVMSIGGNVLFKDSHGHSLVEIHPGKLTDSLPFPFQSYIEENRPEPSHSDVESTQPFPVGFTRGRQFFAYSSSQTYADKLPS